MSESAGNTEREINKYKKETNKERTWVRKRRKKIVKRRKDKETNQRKQRYTKETALVWGADKSNSTQYTILTRKDTRGRSDMQLYRDRS